MQVCRRAYIVKDKESDIELEVDNQYIMSPKDLKTIHFMDEMIEAGVRVFKIEGRARGPEYVRTVVECYKEAIQSYLDGTFSDEKVADWDTRLKRCSTVVSGTDITWDNVWENGARTTVQRLRSARYMPDAASSISPISEWLSS